MAKSKKKFEQMLEELEKIVMKLENSQLPLEESMKSFKEGLDLSEQCSKSLDEIEGKISVLLTGPDGEIAEQLFDNVEG